MSHLSWLQGPDAPDLVERSIGDVLDDAAERYPDNDAIISVGQAKRLTFRELRALADRTASALTALGVEKGDRIAVWSANRYEWVALQFAVAKVGAILVSVNPAYREEELEHVVAHSGCKLLFLTSMFRSFDCLKAAANVKSTHTHLQSLVHFDEGLKTDVSLGWGAFIELGKPGAFRGRNVGPRELASIQYTSGTTGKPKGVTLSHYSLINNALHVGGRLRLTPHDRVCLPVPLFHCFGMVIGVLGALTRAACIVFPGTGFDPDECIDAIERESCTAFYGVPMMFIAILNRPDFDEKRFRSLRTGLMGGAPCPSETLRAAMDRMHMPELSVVYGMTETSPISSQTSPDDSFEVRTSTVGKPHPHVEIKVADFSSGEPVQLGERGEYCVRGYLVMDGYWNDATATAATIDKDGWLRSGDIAVFRDDGNVEIVGRVKDMLIRGGENIFPREIEEFLYRLPEIADVHVFGVPDTIYGEQVCAWIRLKPGANLDGESLRSACKGRIASYKIPHYLRFVEEFPTTASGKIQKFRMREIEIEERHLLDTQFSVEQSRSMK